MDRVAMSPEGYRKLSAELEALKGRAPELHRAIGEAREQGDLSENAAYHAAREELSKLEARIRVLQGQLAGAEIVDPAKTAAARGTAVFGSTVRVRNLDDDEEEVYTLVGPGEADVLAGRILTTSPVGQALLTRRAGDVVEVPVPRGRLRLRVEEVS